MLNVENPLVEPTYYVGQGVILRTLEIFKCALDSGEISYDGAERNSIIEEFQKLGDIASYDARFQAAVEAAM